MYSALDVHAENCYHANTARAEICRKRNRAKDTPMDETQKWRELLGDILHDAKEKQRVAKQLKLNPLTLTRWINGDATPRPYNLRLLLKVLPQYRTSLLEMMPAAWKSTLDSPPIVDEPLDEISSAFFVRVLNTYSNQPKIVRFHSLCDMILQRMLKHLDYRRLGMEITLVRCYPPLYGDKIHSLREVIGRGTPPWSEDTEQRTFFLGSESLAGYVVTVGRPIAVQSREEKQYLFPVHWTPGEESAMACPFVRDGRIAGCLLVSSSQSDYFLPDRQTLIEQYTELIALVFESDEFYDFGRIELYMMPPFDVQQAAIATFRERVDEMFRTVSRKGGFMNFIQAEEIVWHQIEAELAESIHRMET